MNISSVSSIQIIWEAFKATCRGWVISHASAKLSLGEENAWNLDQWN